jgi:hypothetical protein
MRLPLFASLVLSGIVDASKASDHALRKEFVQKMDDAMVHKKKQDDLNARLLRVATPVAVDEQPRFLEEYQDFAINITDYALKYIGCQNVHTYSDELAYDEDSESVLGMNRFVIVRLCPRDTCSNYNEYGCNAGFGDYLIPMEDYLETMAENYFAQYQEYCETCYSCMHQQEAYENSLSNYTNGDDAYNGDDANNRRRLADDDGANDDAYYANADFYNNNDDANNENDNDDLEACEYVDVCENYRTACKDYSQYANDMEEFFECGEFNVGNYAGYLGPHCRSDGKTIGIGLYKDENCNSYNSDLLDISEMTGMDLSDYNLKAYYSSQCISCLASVSNEAVTLLLNSYPKCRFSHQTPFIMFSFRMATSWKQTRTTKSPRYVVRSMI